MMEVQPQEIRLLEMGFIPSLIKVTPDNQKGTYRFEFQAQDRRNALSNIINHNVVIK